VGGFLVRSGAVVAASALTLVLSGCAVFSHPPTERSSDAAAPAGCPSSGVVAAGTSYQTVALLPADVAPRTVLRCSLSTTGGSGILAETVEVADAPDLLAALRLEDIPAPFGQSCDASLALRPWTAVGLEDGTWLPVGWPVDECAKPRPEVDLAMQAASWAAVAQAVNG
jgi:hypothetical protein